MREIYHWTEWFSELANKIAEGGETYLADAAKKITWRNDDKVQPLLRYGDKNIDPFSFFYSLAQWSQDLVHRNRIYPSVNLAFNMERQPPVELDDSDDAFVFPTPPYNASVLFHGGPQSNPELLWNLFRSAVRGLDSVVSEDFDGALKIRHVGKVKLTQALFLINSSQFLPCDDKMNIFVDLPNNEFNWAHYREWLQKVRDMFPGCASYEVNLLGYLWQKRALPIREKYFQVSTNADGPKEGDFWKDLDPKRDFEPNNWVLTGGPKSGVSWEDYEPRDGDQRISGR